jgi:3-phosphoshikimate 1-carboxyvinyltransferase
LNTLLSHIRLPEQEIELEITGSKSESNRLLILKALYPQIYIDNLSESDDTLVLQKALSNQQGTIDVHHAGTAMRFLTAYFACKEGADVLLTGSDRMQERPIGILVEALKDLGADIEYVKKKGYPPLQIKGKSFVKNEVTIPAHTSSQFISALMLIAPSLPQGLVIHLLGEITSTPYINMTLSLLKRLGIEGTFNNALINIPSQSLLKPITVTVESDWSSASYFYSIVALSAGLSLKLCSYRGESLQGDAALAQLYESLGVKTTFLAHEHAIVLTRLPEFTLPHRIDWNLINTPDIAQTIAVSCFGLGVGCYLTGLHTLKIKETDRLLALQCELQKMGATIEVTENSLYLHPSHNFKTDVSIETYHDHRMAMAFAPMALKTSLKIMDSNVVSKSFPSYWDNLKTLGFSIVPE